MKAVVLDDWLGIARECCDWSPLESRLEDLRFFCSALASEQEAVSKLKEFDIILAMRDRTAFPRSLVQQLKKLKLLAFTGTRASNIDIVSLQRRGVTVCYTELFDYSAEMPAELALALMLAAAKKIPACDASMRAGKFQEGLPTGLLLHGKTLGILGLGRLGSLMARYGGALGMHVIAWSPNLTAERARSAGAEFVGRDALFAESDVISIHMVLSESTRGLVGDRELGLMKNGAILVNTSRGPLVQEEPLVAHLKEGKIFAALDVYDREPLPADHPLRGISNTILTPHSVLNNREALQFFYHQLIEDAVAFLDGKPIRVCATAEPPNKLLTT